MNAFLFILCSLAAFRMAELVVEDNGPFHICATIRRAFKPHPWLYEMVTCFYCMSSYTAAGVMFVLWAYGITPLAPLLWWGAIWGGAVVILRVVRER